MKRAFHLVLVLTIASLLISCAGEPTAELAELGSARIVRDTYGVPHIYASTEADAAFGLGYAMAEDRLEQIFTTKRTAQGRLAELAGKSALETDIVIRGYRLYPRAEAIIAEMDADILQILAAYSEGVNSWIESHPDQVPDWIDRYDTTDIVAVGQLVNMYFPMVRLQNEMRALSRRLENNDQRGSNQFAVSPGRSASGNAMLSIDPHLSFSGPLVWAEAHITTPENSLTGCVVPGLPFVIMGHNGHIAWCNTNNYPDLQDIYTFELTGENGSHYISHDGEQEFLQLEEVFSYKTEEGSAEETRTLLISHIGPVLKVHEDTAYVGRISGFDVPTMLKQTYMKGRARSVEEYFEAMRTPGMTMWNQMVADTDGNIGYLWNGLVPLRNAELDWSKPVDGSDARSQWGEFLTFDDFPKVINPESGWLQNCNDSPWHVTQNSGIDEDVFSEWIIDTTRYGRRGERMTSLLSADNSVTAEEMKQYATDTYVLDAEWWVPRLLEAYDRLQDEMNLEGSTTAQAIELLRNWDFFAEADSTAMTVFHVWYFNNRLFDVTRNEDKLTEDILRKQMLELGAAVAELTADLGTHEIPWGEFHYLNVGEQEYPLAGGGYFDVIRAAWGNRNKEDSGRIQVNGGSSYTMVVEMAETPVAWSAFPMSMSIDPDDPHFSDITAIYANNGYKPVWYSWEDVEQNKESDIIVTR